jgi:myo-inositol-1(or 4)-monophosphatase
VSETELLAVAQAAARAAADELTARFGKHVGGVRAKSSPTDPVTEADLAAEAAIREVLGRLRPDDRILGEEGGATGDGELRWVVDPLDGTVNFLYGIPAFSVSVACEDAAGALVGVVLDPVRGECFAATRSGPATLDGEPIAPSGCSELASALVGTGFGYDAQVRARQGIIATTLLSRVRDIRRIGSAALDLCACACGRYDAFYERGLKHWDRAAGALVCQRAGLVVRMLEARDGMPDGVVVAPPALIDELFEIVDAVPFA